MDFWIVFERSSELALGEQLNVEVAVGVGNAFAINIARTFFSGTAMILDGFFHDFNLIFGEEFFEVLITGENLAGFELVIFAVDI